ncbi:MAG TPA: 5'/3'-nucleotidase SurE [Acidimicrobiales bacterium]|nr:5'/3'-nucleotidase SurE [Acidimicrobiales bacterium]
MKVLVTNDDGVSSRGLHALARALIDAGYDVVVAAPDREMSGMSAAIGQVHVDEAIDAEPVDLPRLEGVPCYAVAGPPGLCVLAARLGGFGEPPGLVVSGVNPGCNTGRAVLHSGTVGAALTAANFGASGIAVSIDVSTLLIHEQAGAADLPTIDGGGAVAEVVADVEAAAEGQPAERFDRPAQWDVAATVAASFVDWVVAAPKGTVLNVNVPNRPLDQLAGVRSGQLAPFGTVRTGVVEAASPSSGRLQLELRPTRDEMPPESDSALVKQGFVAITALTGVGIDSDADLAGALDALPRPGRRTA